MRSIRNCSVCVAGGAGFLGSQLVDHLIEDRGCQVLVLDNLVSGHRKFVHPKAVFEHADITGSEAHLHRLMKQHQVQFAWNYAASPYIPVSFARPLRTFEINAMGALQFINAAQDAGVEGILQVSSAEIYGELVKDPGADYSVQPSMAEDAVVSPHSTYGASKAGIDFLVQARWREARTPCIAMRQFNCVGPRETHPYVVPEIIGQLAKGPVVRLGNNSFRDFQDSGDAVRMAAELLEYGQFGEVYNMGSEGGMAIYDLARLIGTLMGHTRIEIVEDESRKRPWEIWYLRSNSTKLYATIPSRPRATLAESLQKTIRYYFDNGQAWDW